MSEHLLRREPFRLLFPLGGMLGCVAIAPWLGFGFGLTESYPGEFHRLVGTRAFLMCFAMGFLFTALPRRTSSASASWLEVALAMGLPVAVTVAAIAGRIPAVELGYAAMHALLVLFALRRFRGPGAGRRPPAAFVAIPCGALAGGCAAVWLATGPDPGSASWTAARRIIEQGVFLCWFIGVGGLFLPLVSGRRPPADLGSSPRESWRAVGYLAAVAVILGSLGWGAQGSLTAAPLARGAAVALAFGLGAGAWRPPGRPGLPRWLVWFAVGCAPLGLIAAALWPAQRADFLHLVFISSFCLGALAVATHVTLGHTGREDLANGNAPAVVVLGFGLVVAAMTRVVAPFTSSYALHLGIAASFWLLAVFVWWAFIVARIAAAGLNESSE